MPRGQKPIDITGQRFGRLVAVELSEKRRQQAWWRCQCDCGKTYLTRGSSLRRGAVKSCGCTRFPSGSEHPSWRGGSSTSHGYVTWRMRSGKRIGEHTVVAEKVLGRPLPSRAVVHHVDENRGNNNPSNLVICQDFAYHNFLHKRLRALRACGHKNWQRCYFCKTWKAPTEFTSKRVSACRVCRKVLAKKWWQKVVASRGAEVG